MGSSYNDIYDNVLDTTASEDLNYPIFMCELPYFTYNIDTS